MYGNSSMEGINFDNGVEPTTHTFANVGLVKFYGSTPKVMSRLHKPANPGTDIIFVEKDLAWKSGDDIALVATGRSQHQSENVTIESYDATTGEIKLKN
jgi:hypothetical protein